MVMEDFDAYWAGVDEELARYPMAAERAWAPLRTTEYARFYTVRLTGIGPYRLFGYYSVPVGAGPFPALYLTPRYGSVNNPPHADDRARYCVFTLMHRGQRLADRPFAAAYPGLLTLGITSPATYIYRAIVADCLRGLEFLRAQPEVDTSRIGIVGDDLALLVAARRPSVTAVQAGGLMFYRLTEARVRTEAYPLEEVNEYVRSTPDDADAVAQTLTRFDPRNHAPHVTAQTLLTVGDAGAVGGAEWLAPLADALGGPVTQYPLTHEGQVDHDWADAWMANALGSVPKPRMWEAAKGAE